jgi:hypothetical protein
VARPRRPRRHAARPRPRLHVTRVARRRAGAARDRGAQPVLQRILRGPDDVGRVRARRRRLARAAERRSSFTRRLGAAPRRRRDPPARAQ